MNHQREAMVETLWLRDGQHRDHREAQADAVIQHLWQRADDPEVITEVSDHIHYLMRFGGMMSDEDRADGIIDALLIPLLGPRPSGEENEK